MRFDPKLIHPDEPPLAADGELDLPADLAALAEQLGADAAHLTATYPVGRIPTSPVPVGRSPASSPTWKRVRDLAVGAAAIAALWIAAVAWQPPQGEQPLVHTVPADSPAALPAPTSPVAAIANPAASDVVSLAELSGPELEALLDMLDGDSARDTSISF